MTARVTATGFASGAPCALDAEVDDRAFLAAQQLRVFVARETLGRAAVDRQDDVARLQPALLGRAVGDDVGDAQQFRVVVDADRDADAAEVSAVETLVERRVLLGREEGRVAYP